MSRLSVTYDVLDASRESLAFVFKNKYEFLNIYANLFPFIIIIYFVEAIVLDLLFSSVDFNGLFASFLSFYFLMSLNVSWYQFVLQDKSLYSPMNIFKPKQHELDFIGVAAVFFIFSTLPFALGIGFVMSSIFLFLSFALFFLIVTYLYYRLMFFFPVRSINVDLPFSHIISLSEGYVFRCVLSGFLALLPVMLLTLLWQFVSLSLYGALHDVFASRDLLNLFLFLVKAPFVLLFTPLMSVIGVTVVANYYQHAMRNSPFNKNVSK